MKKTMQIILAVALTALMGSCGSKSDYEGNDTFGGTELCGKTL